MSTAAQQVVNSFAALQPDEQSLVLRELIESTRRYGGPDLTDDELAQIADEGFLAMDQAEAKHAQH